MSRTANPRKPSEKLRQYAVYLDPTIPADRAIIAYLDSLTRAGRAGGVIRTALKGYLGGGVAASPTFVMPSIQDGQLPAETGNTKDVSAKVRNTFVNQKWGA